MNELDREILEYLLDHPGAYFDALYACLFASDHRHVRLLYRHLERFEKEGMIRRVATHPYLGASSAKMIFLRAKGAHAIGQTMPRDHGRIKQGEYMLADQGRYAFFEMARRLGAEIIDQNEQMRSTLASVVKNAAQHQYGQLEPDYVYFRMIPENIEPDTLLCTRGETYLIILSHPHARYGAFKERIKRYDAIIPYIFMICFGLNGAQLQDWRRAIAIYDAYHHSQFADRIEVRDIACLDEGPDPLGIGSS